MITTMQELKIYKKKYNFFPTPAPIAKMMAELVNDIGRDALMLEPSAGTGTLIEAIKKECKFTPQIDFCEIQDELANRIVNHKRVGSDFLEYNPGQIYNAVVMNPPYKNGNALTHVNHAWDCTKPGGKIVALVDETTAYKIDEEFSGFVFERELIKKGFQETAISVVCFLISKPLY